LVVALVMIASACSGTESASTTSSTTTTSTTTLPPTTTTTTVPGPLDHLDGVGFDEFVESSYEVLLLRRPQFLTSLGVSDQYGLRDDQLDDLSIEFLFETQTLEVGILQRLLEFDRAVLTPEQQVSFDVYEWYLDQQVRGHPFVFHEYPLHHFINSWNFNLILFLTDEHPMQTVEDAEDYIARIDQIDDQAGQILERLAISEGMEVLPTRYLVGWTIYTLEQDLGGSSDPDRISADRLSLFTTFRTRLGDIEDLSDADRQTLLEDAEAAVTESFIPSWLALVDHMKMIEPLAPTDAGVWRFPDGDAYYEWLLRGHTSTDLTPDEVHELGLEQVARVQAEMRAAFDDLGYPAAAALGELRDQARTEAGTVTGGRTAVVEAHEALIAGAEAASREFFGFWPEADVRVVADDGGGGYYSAGSVDGTRPGAFYASTSPSLYLMPTVTYHEAIPGHHLQIALAQERDVPTFRRYIQYNAFAEGWGLYAERLAYEVGLYDDDPYGNIGRLELELLRAVRLVVDTGLHSKRWTDEDARKYMDEAIPGWSREVERYMVLPGQATGYMVGMLQLLEMREDFDDLVAFHDAVLGGGSMPLGVLGNSR